MAINVYTIVARKVFRNDFPTVFGYGSAEVVSDSMETEISRGDWIIVRRENSYEVGDIVTFKDGSGYTTHRIIATLEDGRYQTQGDNNDSPDAIPVFPKQVVGSVRLVIPNMGRIMGYFRQPIGLITLAVFAAALIFLPDWIAAACKKEDGEPPQGGEPPLEE